LLALFIVFSIFAQHAFSAAVPPRIFTYQGRVLNTNGVPVSDATVDIAFELYDSLEDGTCLWTNSSATCLSATARTVTLTDGLFSENLGVVGDSYAAIEATVFGDDASVYLQVTIEGEILEPRKRMAAVPYALNSDTLDGIGSSDFFQVAAANTVTGTNDFVGSIFAGAKPLAFDGSTAADSVETTFSFTDPTVDRTVSFQDASGTVAFLTDIGWTDGGTTVYATTATDNVAIGGTVVDASVFGVDPLNSVIYVGDGASANGSITFKASDADAGTLSYTTDDLWAFNGGNVTHAGVPAYPSSPGSSNVFSTTGTVSSGASGVAGSSFVIAQLQSMITNSAAEAGINQTVVGVAAQATNTGSGQTQDIMGVEAIGSNASTDASAVGNRIYGVKSVASNSGAAITIPTTIGVYGESGASAGTVTNAIGIFGNIGSSAGTLTTSLAGDFSNTNSGATRYGVRATASGGANGNYAGYFFGSAVHIDNTATPSTATYATGTGDLYIYDQLEIDGAGTTTGRVIDIDNDSLTSGSALYIVRGDSGTDISGSLAHLAIDDVGSNGKVLNIQNGGTGVALSINQLGDQIPLVVSANSTTDYIATFTNGGNLDTNMGISIQACLNTNPTGDCDYLVFKDGNGTSIGAVEGDTLGGVTNASAGSDYAELFLGTLSDFSSGDVIGLDVSGNVNLASNSDDIIGAFSVAPNTLGNWFDGWRDAGTYVPVALLGQVPITVNMQGGAISAGDYITLSTTPGVAKKATGVGYVLGQALESHSSGTGTIQVYVKPTWQAIGVLTDSGSMTLVSDDLTLGATGTSDASTQGMDSYGLMLRGSGWDGASAQDVSLGFATHVTDASEYKLSIENGDLNELALVNQDGDLAIAGRLYPSDQGTLQTDKYIYYDGSSGLGGDFMRTNASGWGSGSYDFAEMFPAVESVAPGEVVVFANNDESIMRSTGIEYDDKIAGIVSTQPGFLAGQNIDGHVPVALAGRVPTYVSSENGSINVGDPLTTSSTPGYAMKAVDAGPIVGYAMEAFSGGTGSITVFVRPSYYDGQEPDISDNSLTSLIPSSSLDLSGVMNLNGGSLVSVSSMVGIGSQWSVDDSGTFRTGDRYVQEIESYGGETIETYAVTSRETTIQISGTIELEQGRAHVFFDDYDEDFADIVSLTAPYRVFLTADGITGPLYAMNRDQSGFIIHDTDETSHIDIDWLVIAYHKDYEPEEEIVEDNIAEEEMEEVVEDVEVVDESEEVVEEEVEEVSSSDDDQEVEEVVEEDLQNPDESEEAIDDEIEPIQSEAKDPVDEQSGSEEEAEEVIIETDPIIEDVVIDSESVEVITESDPVVEEEVVEEVAEPEPIIEPILSEVIE